MLRSSLGHIAIGLIVVSLAVPAGAQQIAGKGRTGAVPAPVLLDTTGMFQAQFVKVGDDMFIGGQPTERALRDLRAQGVTTVVNLRMPEEMTRAVKFDGTGASTKRANSSPKAASVAQSSCASGCAAR